MEATGMLSPRTDHKGRRYVIPDDLPPRDSEPHFPRSLNLPMVEPVDLDRTKCHLYGTDHHSPYFDKDAVNLWLSVLASQKWESVILGGDVSDFYAISRFDKDPRRALEMQAELDITAGLLKDISDAAGSTKKKIYIPGNHEGRFQSHLRQVSPALTSLRSNTVSEQLHLKELGFQFIPPKQHYFLTPNFRIAHGAGPKDDGCKLSKHSAWSAMRNLEKFWMPGLSGHGHRLGSHWATKGARVFWWHEGGALCDIEKVSRDYATEANWQNGMAILYEHDDGNVQVELVPIVGGKCVVQGKLFQV